MHETPVPTPIPEGFRWEGHRFVQPTGSSLEEHQLKKIENAVALRDLVRSLKHFAGCDASLKMARKGFRLAALQLAVAHERVDYLDLPGPPWLIDDKVIDWDGHHYNVIVCTRLPLSPEETASNAASSACPGPSAGQEDR